ncbi:Uncharacterized protein At4g02000 [Linum perenne]
MDMQEDETDNPRCPKIVFSDAEVKNFYKPWSKAIVVKVLEKSFSYLSIKKRLEFLWAKAGRIQVADLANSFFLVRFSSEDDYQRAAFGGPWKIFDYYITVGRWSPSFDEEEPIKKILTWVRLPRLPIHYFNEVAVTRIGNYIGKTIRLDLATSSGARARYARVCVEIDLTKPLLGKYSIDNRIYRVEYESLENICFSCGTYGHKEDRCPDKEVAMPTGAAVERPHEEVKSPEGDVGCWMTVSRRNRKRDSGLKASTSSEKGSGSRFTVLSSDEGVSPDEPLNATELPPEAPKVSPPSYPKAASHVKAQSSPQAEALRKVLEEALANAVISEVPKDTEKSVNQPLKEVSNVIKTKDLKKKNTAKDTSSRKKANPDQENIGATLFSVPVAYVNPIFQASLDPSTSAQSIKVHKMNPQLKLSSAGGKTKTETLAKKLVSKPVKKFMKKQPVATNASGSEGAGQRAGKTPDQSC